MCERCNSSEFAPQPARPLNFYDVLALFASLGHNLAASFVEFFTAAIDMTQWEIERKVRNARAWAALSKDLETLESDNG